MPDENLLPRIASGRTDLIAVLLADIGPAPLPTVQNASLLDWAAYYGDVTAVRLLLAQGAALTELGPDLGLNGAAFHGHWQLCQFLLESGASAAYADRSTGETTLHSALTNDDRPRYDLVVQVLLAAGADPSARTIPGVPTGAFMRDSRTRGEAPLHRAAAFGRPQTVQMLLDAGADPTQVDAHGDTPLSWASWYRRPVEVLRLLLHGGYRIRSGHQSMRENLLGSP